MTKNNLFHPNAELSRKVDAFVRLGKFLEQFTGKTFKGDPSLKDINDAYAEATESLIENIHFNNPWFTPEFVRYAISAIAASLQPDNINHWISSYPELNTKPKPTRRVGVIMAGNIPMVGFHDFLCILLSGHKFIGRLSSKDDKLLPAIAKVLVHILPEFRRYIQFTDELMKETHAIIATGGDNSSRYFEYYFGKNPNIIRKNRNSVAILSGNETTRDLKNLADDIFIYFGLGCRNVSKLFLPAGYDIPGLLKNFEHYSYFGNHHKYANNYDYQKAIYLVNQVPHLDTGFLLVKEDPSYSSPVGCLFYEYYHDTDSLFQRLKQEKDQIQCVATKLTSFYKRVKFSSTQKPMLWDYADNMDTLKFLLNLSQK